MEKTQTYRFRDLSEQIKAAVSGDPALSAMMGILLVQFESQVEQIKSQSSR
ncbi:MAG: hypothetical protein ACI4UM_00995 [Succinivibrio sp.]